MPTAVSYYIGDESPTLPIWWIVNGSLQNFSSGWTFSGKLYRADDSARTVLFTKSSGFTGAAGSGTSSNGTPNLTVTWATSGDFNTNGLTAGRHEFQIIATNTGSEMTTVVPIDLFTRV